MCGIAGLVSKSNITTGQREAVARMSKALIHRGPDGQGEYNDKAVSLAMRRLSIIDLAGGWQPLYNEDKRLILIANGEIYNYLELTSALKHRGHRFASHSDCEPILHLYEEYGEKCVHHLRGMFAFALYDTNTSRLLLARDRMGEKPLYLYSNKELLLFSSEMKSLLSSGLVPFELDPAAVNDYFHYQYVPEPKTPLKHVGKLPAGTFLSIDIRNWQSKTIPYWRMEDAPPIEGDPVTLIKAELDTISKLILQSEVPVGVALSGGLDSSAIAALTVKKYPGLLHAFSVGYPGRPANDERNDAKALCDHFQMPFHEIELSTEGLVDIFEELNSMRDDPIADISGFGYYAVSKEAKSKNVPVLLQGQGSDELFWGYPWVKDAVVQTGSSARLITSSDETDRNFCGQSSFRFNKYAPWVKWFAAAFRGAKRVKPDGRKRYRPVFHELAPDFQIALNTMSQYYTSDFKERLAGASAFDLFTYDVPWEYTDIRITRLICETYLLENGIAQGDRLSMANSVELRLPFVDYKLVELIVGLRKTHQENPDYKQFPKPWLREAMQDVLPSWVIQRPKQGFAPPVREWHTAIFNKYGARLKNGHLVRAGVLTPVAGDILSAGPYPPDAIAPISFKALVLEMWCRKMISFCNENANVL